MSACSCDIPMSRRDWTRRAAVSTRVAIALAGVTVALSMLVGGCETRQEWLTKSRIRNVERGLLRAIYLKGQQPEKLSLETRMQFYRVPGAGIAVMDRDRLEWARGYGVRDVHLREPVTEGTIFQAGALSQAVVAAAALQMVGRGRLGLDADLAPRLRELRVPVPGAAPAGRLTLRGILSHADGLPPIGLPGYAAGQKVPGLVDLLRGGGPFTPAADPASGEAGFAALQVLLEAEARTPFPSLMRAALLDPLGMKSSTLRGALARSRDARRRFGPRPRREAHRREMADLSGGGRLRPLDDTLRPRPVRRRRP